MEQVEIEEASRNLAELIARAASGEEIVIIQAGKAMVRLEPIKEAELENRRVEEQGMLNEEEEGNNSLMEDMLSAYEEEIS